MTEMKTYQEYNITKHAVSTLSWHWGNPLIYHMWDHVSGEHKKYSQGYIYPNPDAELWRTQWSTVRWVKENNYSFNVKGEIIE